MFLRTWVRSGGTPEAVDPLLLDPSPEGLAAVQVVGGHGLRARRALRRSYLAWISLARERIFLANAYFAPEAWLRRALCRAARRGVRVDLLLPGRTDAPLVSWAGRASYPALLECGASIRELDAGMLHAKVATFDDRVLLTGSANLDYRSFRHNLEIAVTVFDPATARAALAALERDFERARPVTTDSWRRRSLLRRALERSAYSVRYWL
jgi:cardiolipin synthase